MLKLTHFFQFKFYFVKRVKSRALSLLLFAAISFVFCMPEMAFAKKTKAPQQAKDEAEILEAMTQLQNLELNAGEIENHYFSEFTQLDYESEATKDAAKSLNKLYNSFAENYRKLGEPMLSYAFLQLANPKDALTEKNLAQLKEMDDCLGETLKEKELKEDFIPKTGFYWRYRGHGANDWLMIEKVEKVNAGTVLMARFSGGRLKPNFAYDEKNLTEKGNGANVEFITVARDSSYTFCVDTISHLGRGCDTLLAFNSLGVKIEAQSNADYRTIELADGMYYFIAPLSLAQ